MTLEIYNKGVDQFLTPYYVAHLMAEMNFSEKGKQLKKGYPLQMNWTLVPGSKGAVKIKPSSYNNSTYNDVDNLYPSVDSYCQTKKWLRLLNSYNNQFDELNQKRHNKTIGKNHRCYTSSIANSGISTWSIFGGS
ncbi:MULTISPECIES: hypothetical protein [Enterococcus]|uniref:hypothetical protein n=1 Tax=Enterococcus TaxID=1350 RepID=UPI003C77F022